MCPCAIFSKGMLETITNFICKMLVGLSLIGNQLKSQHENSYNSQKLVYKNSSLQKMPHFTNTSHLVYTEVLIGAV